MGNKLEIKNIGTGDDVGTLTIQPAAAGSFTSKGDPLQLEPGQTGTVELDEGDVVMVTAAEAVEETEAAAPVEETEAAAPVPATPEPTPPLEEAPVPAEPVPGMEQVSS